MAAKKHKKPSTAEPQPKERGHSCPHRGLPSVGGGQECPRSEKFFAELHDSQVLLYKRTFVLQCNARKSLINNKILHRQSECLNSWQKDVWQKDEVAIIFLPTMFLPKPLTLACMPPSGFGCGFSAPGLCGSHSAKDSGRF